MPIFVSVTDVVRLPKLALTIVRKSIFWLQPGGRRNLICKTYKFFSNFLLLNSLLRSNYDVVPFMAWANKLSLKRTRIKMYGSHLEYIYKKKQFAPPQFSLFLPCHFVVQKFVFNYPIILSLFLFKKSTIK